MSKPASLDDAPITICASEVTVASPAVISFTVTDAPDKVCRFTTILPDADVRLLIASDLTTKPSMSVPIPVPAIRLIVPKVSILATSVLEFVALFPSIIWPPVEIVTAPLVTTIPPPVKSSAGFADRI